MSNRALLIATTAVAPLVWGSTYLATTELLPPGRPLLAALLRALPAGLLLVLLARRLPTGSWWWRAAVLGALNIGVFFALLFVAAHRLPGGVAAVLGAVQPLLVAALAPRLLGERTTALAAAAAGTGFLGVALLVLRADARLDALGATAALAGAVAMAFGTVLTRRWGQPAPLLATTGWQLVAGGLLLLPLTLAVEGLPATLNATHAAGFAYLGLLGTALAYVLWFRGVAALPATVVAPLGLLSPLVATVLGWAVLGQSLTGGQLLGAGLVLTALAAAQLAGARPAVRAALESDPRPAPRPALPPVAGRVAPAAARVSRARACAAAAGAGPRPPAAPRAPVP
ncbi:putative blue pigment (indigoidine) exporter [Kineococcus xinjiangensis]|uniref:Putative blue pigment (Indigoidine) exporter n=1 Tax=Kineococcus xinjiangensis TaxID=512762 RepID=A0A2S6IVW5_9ACTN|nr:EamA family transporter [Kineococcus xinjiangensis]PPK98435.1 putative blue pigment (indigoidine) exporter [Kineococcus xinjiangensis]